MRCFSGVSSQANANTAFGKNSVEGKATAYVCEHGTCRAPVTSAGELKALLDDYQQTA